MSGREWKPGDAAIAAHPFTDGTVRGIIDTDGRFYTTDQSLKGVSSSAFAPGNLRPLVVLDLNAEVATPHVAGRTEAERLVSMLRETADEFFVPDAAELARKVADQIEAQTRPPKPAEPTGLGAVVEGRDENRWIRTEESKYHPWRHVGSVDRVTSWEGIDAYLPVTVLSEGVIA